ncbi:hypothetical protein BU17DRAFT_69281 [Hysterangium stoloniferum]|nr:hypothetical protein BU17DRAFT_69281 [Hysterangium stoloniferum]
MSRQPWTEPSVKSLVVKAHATFNSLVLTRHAVQETHREFFIIMSDTYDDNSHASPLSQSSTSYAHLLEHTPSLSSGLALTSNASFSNRNYSKTSYQNAFAEVIFCSPDHPEWDISAPQQCEWVQCPTGVRKFNPGLQWHVPPHLDAVPTATGLGESDMNESVTAIDDGIIGHTQAESRHMGIDLRMWGILGFTILSPSPSPTVPSSPAADLRNGDDGGKAATPCRKPRRWKKSRGEKEGMCDTVLGHDSQGTIATKAPSWAARSPQNTSYSTSSPSPRAEASSPKNPTTTGTRSATTTRDSKTASSPPHSSSASPPREHHQPTPNTFYAIITVFDPKRGAAQVTTGLQHACTQQIMHRDITPQNIPVPQPENGKHCIRAFCRPCMVQWWRWRWQWQCGGGDGSVAVAVAVAAAVRWHAPEVLRGDVKLDEQPIDEDEHDSSSRGRGRRGRGKTAAIDEVDELREGLMY